MSIDEAKAKLDIPSVAARCFPNWKPALSCHSPWREDRNPSFSVFDQGRKWKDHSTGDHGDAVDFLGKALDIPAQEAIRRFVEMAGGGYREQSRPTARPSAPLPPADSDDKRHKRAMWPAMELPTNDELEAIATLRRLPLDGPHWASMDGALRMANVEGQRCFIIRSTCGKNAQARRLDGQPLGENLKAKTLAGSIATLPVGNYHDRRWPAVAVVEGGPDVLAAYAAIYKLGLLDTVAVAGMLGAAMRPPYGALATMAGRRVRIFQHNDEAGQKAADSWARLIHNAGGDVDIWTPAQAGADLNDIFHLTESELSEALAEAFDFVKGGF
jgi:DNA primase